MIQTIRLNLKIIFAGKFVFFLIASWIFFFIMVTIALFSAGYTEEEDIYYILLFSGALIIIYPITYHLQNDKDNRIIEIIFGVPDYRYLVYLVRFGIVLLVLFFMLFAMSILTWFSIFRIDILPMVFQEIVPLLFISSLIFLFSTLFKNANATAVVIILIGTIFLFIADIPAVSTSKWNLFLNPYNLPSDMDISIWLNIVGQNRLIMGIGTLISLLWGLTNLQRREKLLQ